MDSLRTPRASHEPSYRKPNAAGGCRFQLSALPGRSERLQYGPSCGSRALQAARTAVKEQPGLVAPRRAFGATASRTQTASRTAALPPPPPKPRFLLPSAEPLAGAPVLNGDMLDDLLQGGNARGQALRSDLKGLMAESPSAAFERPGRWSGLKVLYTELLDALNGVSVANLLATTAGARELGAAHWPELAQAEARLQVLLAIQDELFACAKSADLDAISRVLSDAAAIGIADDPTAPGDQQWAAFAVASRRLNTLRATRAALDVAQRGLSMPQLRTALARAEQLGVGAWPEVKLAMHRLKSLQLADEQLRAVVECHGSDEQIKHALEASIEFAQSLGVSALALAPLGPHFAAAQDRLSQLLDGTYVNPIAALFADQPSPRQRTPATDEESLHQLQDAASCNGSAVMSLEGTAPSEHAQAADEVLARISAAVARSSATSRASAISEVFPMPEDFVPGKLLPQRPASHPGGPRRPASARVWRSTVPGSRRPDSAPAFPADVGPKPMRAARQALEVPVSPVHRAATSVPSLTAISSIASFDDAFVARTAAYQAVGLLPRRATSTLDGVTSEGGQGVEDESAVTASPRAAADAIQQAARSEAMHIVSGGDDSAADTLLRLEACRILVSAVEDLSASQGVASVHRVGTDVQSRDSASGPGGGHRGQVAGNSGGDSETGASGLRLSEVGERSAQQPSVARASASRNSLGISLSNIETVSETGESPANQRLARSMLSAVVHQSVRQAFSEVTQANLPSEFGVAAAAAGEAVDGAVVAALRSHMTRWLSPDEHRGHDSIARSLVYDVLASAANLVSQRSANSQVVPSPPAFDSSAAAAAVAVTLRPNSELSGRTYKRSDSSSNPGCTSGAYDIVANLVDGLHDGAVPSTTSSPRVSPGRQNSAEGNLAPGQADQLSSARRSVMASEAVPSSAGDGLRGLSLPPLRYRAATPTLVESSAAGHGQSMFPLRYRATPTLVESTVTGHGQSLSPLRRRVTPTLVESSATGHDIAGVIVDRAVVDHVAESMTPGAQRDGSPFSTAGASLRAVHVSAAPTEAAATSVTEGALAPVFRDILDVVAVAEPEPPPSAMSAASPRQSSTAARVGSAGRG